MYNVQVEYSLLYDITKLNPRMTSSIYQSSKLRGHIYLYINICYGIDFASIYDYI